MQTAGFLVLLAIVVLGGAYFLSAYMHRVYEGRRTWLTPVFAPVERVIYRVFMVDEKSEMDWKRYAISLLLFSVGVMSGRASTGFHLNARYFPNFRTPLSGSLTVTAAPASTGHEISGASRPSRNRPTGVPVTP